MKFLHGNEVVIRTWMTSTIKNGGIERFDDLHIDRIDRAWQNRTSWIEGGLKAFQLATEARDHDRLELDIALAFSLLSGSMPRGMNFADLKGLEAELDWSPPSLYLLHSGKNPWAAPASSESKTKDIDPRSFDLPSVVKRCSFLEFKSSGSDEFSRTFLLIG